MNFAQANIFHPVESAPSRNTELNDQPEIMVILFYFEAYIQMYPR
jgi:hypothetical protein